MGLQEQLEQAYRRGYLAGCRDEAERWQRIMARILTWLEKEHPTLEPELPA